VARITQEFIEERARSIASKMESESASVSEIDTYMEDVYFDVYSDKGETAADKFVIKLEDKILEILEESNCNAI